ncbi:ergothioneine biosynthesis protein EgtC [Oculatella sp. LEGE 06141]|nr:ergothioneine biosynthesis protein EgtC [Oculatella sp. LEGE 06141]MBE9179240.1 ergothioneine biosynthesis protein EgtC [Oculatella sp. LEGE 06141]
MCRLLGYLGRSIQLDRLLYKPDHSLIVQSYQPREMTAGLLNADGFGVGWHHPHQDTLPFTYRNTLPIWNDSNLPGLSRYIESGCVVASVRSATAGLAVDLNNCPPFQYDRLLAVHNGYIENFRQTLYRPIRDRLSDSLYQSIQGTTDSEHIVALLIHEWQQSHSLEQALKDTLIELFKLAAAHSVTAGANLIVSDGQRLVACRASNRSPAPSLYWLRDDPLFPEAVVIASEPLFAGKWNAFPEHSILSVRNDLDVQIQSFG